MAKLDCAEAILDHEDIHNGLPEVTAISHRNALDFGVGLSNGLVLLYDLRLSRPVLTKDHMYGKPIKKLAFHDTHDQVRSVPLDFKMGHP